MAIFHSPYDTSVGLGFKATADRVANQCQSANIRVSFADNNRRVIQQNFGEGKDPAVTVLATTTAEEQQVEAFPFPVLFNSGSKGSYSESYLAFDGRPFIQGSHLDEAGQFRIKLQTEYDLYKVMTILSAHWMRGKTDSFRYLHKCVAASYGSLIAESISRRFGLDPKDQLIIQIVACVFYMSLFNTETTVTDDWKLKVTPNVTSSTFAKPELIFEVLDKMDSLANLNDLVKAIQICTENPRLSDLNVGILVTIVSGAWFGTNGKALITAALEYPPMWVSILYTAFTERSFKNSGLSKVIDRYRGARGEADFNKQFSSLLRQAMS